MTSDILFKATESQGSPDGATSGLDLGIQHPGTPAQTPIKSTDADGFVADVIETSRTVPVIVGFWAPWSGPCKTLWPILEKLVARTGGLVKIFKINVDENQALAAQLQMQSVPTIYAFKKGHPVDSFAGALPERQVQSFIDRLIGSAQLPLDTLMDEAGVLLDENAPVEAEAIYTNILAKDPSFFPAIAGKICAIVGQKDLPRAHKFIAGLDAKTQTAPDLAHAISVLQLAQQSANAANADIAALQSRIATDENDFSARLNLALALYATKHPREAIEHLLYIVTQDATWNDEAARKQLILIFDALGTSDPLVEESRRLLAAALFA